MAEPRSGISSRDVARLLKSAATLCHAAGVGEDSVASALDLVCAFTGWPLGHVYLVEPGGQRLVPTNIWHNDDPERYAQFVELTKRTILLRGTGLPGRMLETAQPVWIADVRQDPNFPRAEAAAAAGLGAGIGFPIVSREGVEGVAEFYAADRIEPDDALLDLFVQIGFEVGNAIDRGRVQAALSASEARLAEAERLGHMGAWIYQVPTDVLEFSAELCTLYGLDAGTMPRNLEQYLARVHPEDVARVHSSLAHSIHTGSPFEHEYRLLTGEGLFRWAHARGEMLPGHPPRLAGYCQDVTERKLREDAIRTSQRRLAEAQRIAHLGSWSWDVANNDVQWSDELFRIYGLEPGASPATFEAYLGRVHPEDRERVQAAVEHTAATLEPFEHDYRIVRPNGQERFVHARGEVIEQKDGRALQLTGYCHDVTERRLAEQAHERLEHQLHQAQRLESLGQLAGGVAHDFNNLLSVILSYAAFAEQALQSLEETTQEHRLAPVCRDLDQIMQAANRAADLTRQLLAFGRRELVKTHALALNEVIRDLEPLLRRSIGEHVDLRTRLDPQLWPVRGDRGQIERVLVNLAVNARDAMPAGGTVTIETENVEIAADNQDWQGLAPGRYVRLAVADTGCGMPPAVSDRAFEPFFTTKPKGVGSGLGLATVYGIVAQAGGGARIESHPGRGTIVHALLPMADGDEVVPEPARGVARTNRAGGETVLLVENEAAMREVTERMLARHGYAVFAFAGGPPAIDAIARGECNPHLLLTDIIMPGMLGNEVAERVVALSPSTKVLYMSGYAQAVLSPDGELPADFDLLEKPFTEPDLLDRVRDVLERAVPATRRTS